MSCYGKHRPLWVVVAMNVRKLNQPGYFPTIVGPFKTKTQARNAAVADWGDDPDIEWSVQQLITYHDRKDKLITLHFDQFLDPTRRKQKEGDTNANDSSSG